MENKPIQLIGTIEVTEETALNDEFVFNAEDYPEIKNCSYFWIYIENTAQASRPYVYCYVNGTRCNARLAGSTGAVAMFEAIYYKGNAIVSTSTWNNVSLAGQHDTINVTLTGMPKYVGEEIESIGVNSYATFMDAGGKIELYGF